MSFLSILLLTIAIGLLLSINPFEISVFASLLAGAQGRNHSKSKVRVRVLIFLAIYYLFIAIAGIILINCLSLLTNNTLAVLSLIFAILSIFTGLAIAKNYFWYSKKIPGIVSNTLHKNTVKKDNAQSALSLGFCTAAFSIVIVGGVLLNLSSIIVLAGNKYNVTLVLLYPLCLIMPLILIYIFAIKGLKISAIIKWKEESKGVMRLSIGLAHIVLGWIILLVLNGTIGATL